MLRSPMRVPRWPTLTGKGNKGVIEMTVTVDEQKCDGCGTCVDACPVEAIVIDQVAKVDAEICIDCGACEYECPNDAISMPEIEIPASPRNLYATPPSPIPTVSNGSNPASSWTPVGQSDEKQVRRGGLLGQIIDSFRKPAGQGRGRKKGGGCRGGHGKGRHGR